MQTHTQQEAEELRKRVQTQIVGVITKGLKSGEITQERAKQIAQMILEKLPENLSYDQLIHIIPQLDDHFLELSRVVIPIVTEYEQSLKEEMNKEIHKHIQENDFEAVLNLTKKAIEIEKGLA